MSVRFTGTKQDKNLINMLADRSWIATEQKYREVTQKYQKYKDKYHNRIHHKYHNAKHKKKQKHGSSKAAAV